MSDRILGVRPVINAVGPATRLGSSVLTAEVLAAMAAAAAVYLPIHELQEQAGREIAEITGAEAGYVTNGAAAGLMLAAAACIARDDAAAMNRLPDTTGRPDEIVIHRGHRNPYDHALRAAGARLVEVGFADQTFPYELESAIGERTAGVAYLAGSAAHAVPLPEVVQIAHRHDVPVILDASVAVPPAANLRRFADLGVDLVAISGGKWVGGPGASGILAGRADLIRSVALQHQDQDVRLPTWAGASLVAEGVIAGPPHQGIGRALKVGKEEIVGLITALRAYARRDHQADQNLWRARARIVVDALDDAAGAQAELLDTDPDQRGWPIAEITVDHAVIGRSAYDVVNQLLAADPAIVLDETLAWRGKLRVTPTHLRDGEAEVVAAALRAALQPPPHPATETTA